MGAQSTSSKRDALFFCSPWSHPAQNLALEEYLLEHPPFGDPSARVFLLYENAGSLIIGKNQNPWKEISPSALARGIPRLYRRITGGGSVFHGPGNLNFSFIVPQGGFSKEDNLDLVRRAVSRLGLFPDRTDRGDLVLRGLKFSGNALCYRRGRVIHHGTLLVHADLTALRGSLSGDRGPGGGAGPAGAGYRFSIDTRAVASVPMSVANLANFLSGLSVRDVRDVLAREIEASWGPVRVIEDPAVLAPAETLTVLRERYESREWTFGMTPSFTCTVTGAGNLSLLVEHGRVTRAEGLNGAAAEILEKPFDLGLIDSLHKNNHLIAGGPAAEEESNGHPPDVPQAR